MDFGHWLLLGFVFWFSGFLYWQLEIEEKRTKRKLRERN